MDHGRPHFPLVLLSVSLDGPRLIVGTAPQNQERGILHTRTGAATAGTKRRWRFRADLNGQFRCIAGVELHAGAQSLAAWVQVSYTNTACEELERGLALCTCNFFFQLVSGYRSY